MMTASEKTPSFVRTCSKSVPTQKQGYSTLISSAIIVFKDDVYSKQAHLAARASFNFVDTA